MRNSFLFALAAPVALASCGHATRATSRADVDLQHDLQLAATSTMNMPAPQVNPANFNRLETAPQSDLHESGRLRKHAAGSRAVPSRASELHAAPIPEPTVTDAVPQAMTVAQAPAPIGVLDPVATVPRAGGSVARTRGAAGAGEDGSAGRQGGVLGGLGPIIGVVIRGGGVDGDHCEPHGPGLTPGVYLPPPGGFGGTSRFPVFPRGGTMLH